MMRGIDERYVVLGCPVQPLTDEEEAVEVLTHVVNSGEQGYTVAINAEKIMMYRRRSDMQKLIDRATLHIPDGAGAILGLKWLYNCHANKINFPLVALRTAAREAWPLFVLGAQEDVNKAACRRIREFFPEINVVGRAHGYLPDDEKIVRIAEAKPRLVLVGLGSPRQEIFATQLMEAGLGLFAICCGGALDILAGHARRAPNFMVNHYLEWLYRLYKEPSRWRRQLVLVDFLASLVIASLGKQDKGKW